MSIMATYSQFRHTFATSSTRAKDGYPKWPIASLRASGFNAPSVNVGKYGSGTLLPFIVTADGGAICNWYLSQHSDDPAKQYLAVEMSGGSFAAVRITRTALGTSTYPSDANIEHVRGLFRDVTMYLQRQSDDAIQLLRLDDYFLGDV